MNVSLGGAAVLGVVAMGVFVLAVLTAVGGRRRGGGWPLAVVSGAFFPVTWITWYLRDARAAPGGCADPWRARSRG